MKCEAMSRMRLIGTFQYPPPTPPLPHPHFKDKAEVGVKSSASGPQSALQFIHYADTPDLIY